MGELLNPAQRQKWGRNAVRAGRRWSWKQGFVFASCVSGVGEVTRVHVLLVFVELMLAVVVVLVFLHPSEKVSLERGKKVGETERISLLPI